MAVTLLDQMEAKERANWILTRANLLALFAQLDDEIFRSGEILAPLTQRGVRVHVLTTRKVNSPRQSNKS